MGILSFVIDKFTSHSEVVDTFNSGITVTKFIFVIGSVSFLLFGLGYALYGLGSVVKPVSDIIDELHDSGDDNGDSGSDDNYQLI